MKTFGRIQAPQIRGPRVTRFQAFSHFLGQPIILVLAAWMVAQAPVGSTLANEGAGLRFESGRRTGDLDRVTAVLEAGGETSGLVAGKIEANKMSVVCNLVYDEKTLEVPTTDQNRWRSARHYETATAVIKGDQGGFKPTLSPRNRLIAAAVDPERCLLFSPGESLSREELELIDILGNTLLLEQFLPGQPCAVGDSWKLPPRLMAMMLGLDEVAETSVTSKLVEVTEDFARFEMAGRVEGAIYGVETEIDVRAKYRFHRRRERIDWWGMLVKENRGISHVADGVDVVAKLQVLIEPQEKATNLDQQTLASHTWEPDDRAAWLVYQSAAGWRFEHDRRWHVTHDHRDLAILQMVDRGKAVAQCNVSPLPKRDPRHPVTLEEFQRDIERALGESFTEFVEAGQFANQSSYRVYRVVARGSAEDVPIQWNYYLISDRSGHRVVFAFTFKRELADDFADADRVLIGTLTFPDPQVAKRGGE